MSNWLSPDVETLREVISSSEGDLLLCSPYISTPALSIVVDTLPTTVNTIEFWTKLDPRDWITGASDPEGLLDFIHQIQGHVGHVSVRHASHLHAKMIVSDGLKAMAGSANLTAGGFMRNMEVSRLVTGGEIDQLHRIANELRPKLALITQDRLAEFVSGCTTKVESKEALLDLIRQELPSFEADQGSLMPYRDFLSYLRMHDSGLATEILRIATNDDGNNNTGKVKQAFFGVQRFLQEFPHHYTLIEHLPIEWFDIMQSGLSSDWIQFLSRFANEVSPSYQYSIPTLRGYLPKAQGGTLVGGGGGSNELKRVWPFVGRAVRTFNPTQNGESQ